MKKYIVQSVGIRSTLKLGCGIGALANLLPGMIIALTLKAVVSSLISLLGSWQNAELANIFGQPVRANLLAVLKLQDAFNSLEVLDHASFVIFGLVGLGWMLIGGTIFAILVGMVALVYNLSARIVGGIEIKNP